MSYLKLPQMFVMETSKEAIVVIQPRCYCGMDYFGTGVVVQVMSDLTNAADVVVNTLINYRPDMLLH